ncbi:MAG: UDP-N-acetylmuramate dehydrogenase [Holosporales bacterium]|jgi:UDP-N-acetylmuramate dehydrogenase|nr:UDP-N-acetylmuramate dehydrogenase [Holosporales bacterium]
MQHDLPGIRGEYVFDFQLGRASFLRVGGTCDVMFFPSDKDDLIQFLQQKPKDLRIYVVGNLSNVLVPDCGIMGCVVSLTRMAGEISFHGETASVGAGLGLQDFIMEAASRRISSCEYLFGIPGTIGGATVMNAGVSDFEMADSLASLNCIDMRGNEVNIPRDKLNMTYRDGGIPNDLIISDATMRICMEPSIDPKSTIAHLRRKRLLTQPVGCSTCGCTFKNHGGLKAWQLIKEAGCDKLSVGGASVSKIHCNFLINTGNAKASDFIELIGTIKAQVLAKTGILLEEEIVTIGGGY